MMLGCLVPLSPVVRALLPLPSEYGHVSSLFLLHPTVLSESAISMNRFVVLSTKKNSILSYFLLEQVCCVINKEKFYAIRFSSC